MALGLAATPDAGARQLLSWVTPLWLLGLAMLPLIRWLHRGGPRRQALTVSRLALWQGAERPGPAGGERRPPDPAWRRRALLTALLVIALAEPQWHSSRARITVWLDDSLHMLTREDGTTRLDAGWAALQAQLAASGPAEVELRSLGDPWRTRGAPDAALLAAVAAEAGRHEPGPPPEALLSRDRQHWLLTDGADASLLDWGSGRGPDHLVAVGRTQRNAGLQRLAARRDPDDPQRLQLLVVAINGGVAEETREIVVADDSGEKGRTLRTIAAGRTASWRLTLPAAGVGRLRAVLQPGDALAADDELRLDLAPLRRRRLAVDAACPPSVQAAVDAHPHLERSADAAEAAIDCSGLRAPLPTVSLQARQLPTPLTAALRWSSAWPAAQRVVLDPDRLRSAARLEVGRADVVLLAAGDEALIVRRDGQPARIETALDFGAGAGGAAAERPLLLNRMLEQLLGEPLLDGVAMAERSAAASRVVPQTAAPPAQRPDRAVVTTGRPRAATQALLLAALAVLGWELAVLARQSARRRAGTP